MVSWKKYSLSQLIPYLGTIFGSVNMRLIQDNIDKLFLELAFFDGCVRATKRQLQCLCGILSYSAEVIKGAISRCIIDLLKDRQL